MARCLKIIGRTPELQKAIDEDYKPEISHPPEAIEEVRVPVFAYGHYDVDAIGGWHPKVTVTSTQGTVGYIKLHRCKFCKLPVILDGDCVVVI